MTTLHQFSAAVSDDLYLFAHLHGSELPREALAQLKANHFPQGLGLRLDSDHGQAALKVMQQVITQLPDSISDQQLDRLAADFADIYLNYRLRASPCESVWLDPDGLAMQQPMFQIRDWYRRHHLVAEDWRRFSDDHLVLQLQFIAHLLRQSDTPSALGDLATFMDEHLLRWFGDFSRRIAQRCSSDLYAALAILTHSYLEELRDLLAALLEQPRPTPEEIEARMNQHTPPLSQQIEGPYLPGTAPSW